MTVAIILLISFALVIRLIVRKSSRLRSEREWYIENLKYDFSAEVDTVIVTNKKGSGFILCHFTAGKMNLSVEDSLKRHLKRHERLRLFPRRSDGKIRFASGKAGSVMKGDSVTVNSALNKITVFRNGEKLIEKDVRETISGEPLFK